MPTEELNEAIWLKLLFVVELTRICRSCWPAVTTSVACCQAHQQRMVF